MVEELKNEGLKIDKEMDKIFGPVGLDIGAETPEEIALSVMAEIQTVMYGGTGQHLRQPNLPMNPQSKKEIKETIRK